MALVVKDRVQETTTTTGTGTLTLGGAVLGFQTFAVIGNANQTYYAIADPTTGDYEVGIGTYTASGTTLSRTTVLESSNSNSLVNFAAGIKNVFCTYPAERAVYLDTAGSAVTLLDIGTLGVSTANISTANITSGTVSTTPVNNTDIVNKAYADAIASGIHFHEAVNLATTTALPANTYNNGTSGVGATLTANANGALSVDSTLTITSERILVKNEAAGANNGVYTVTQVGSAGTPYILTRATDFDTVGTGVDQIDEGDFFLVTSGTANVNTAWVQQTAPPITIGTTALVFQQFSAPITYTAGTGLSESPSYTFNIANTGTAGTYGGAASVPVFTTNAQGQVTSVTPTGIAIAAAAVSGLAPSATTDTTNASNITSGTLGTSRLSGSYTGVTGVGTLTAGTWNATPIGAVYGGTGQSSYAVGDLVYADTTTSLAKLADVAVGNALISGGVGSAPSYGKIGLATHVSGTLPIANGGTGSTSTQFVALGTNVSGTLPVGNGGTGAATLTANNVLLGNGTSALQVVAPGTNGNVLQSNGTTWVSAVNPSTQVYPGAGIANSTGTSWATSYSTTGTGTVVALATSPSFTTPILGTPQSGNLANCTFPTLNQNTTGNAATASNVAGLVQNSYSGYGNTATTITKTSYYGLLLGTSTSHLNVMADASGNGGFYRESSGIWPFYYLVANNCVGIGTSTTNAAYGIYVTKGGYFDGRVDGTIFYDSNDTAFYVDPNSVSRIRRTLIVAVGAGWDDCLNLYSSDQTNRWNFLVDSGLSNAFRLAYNNSEALQINTSRNVTAIVDFRAPIFYDSNDTTYYTDPSSISSMFGVAVRGDLSTTGTSNQIFFWGSGNSTTSAIGFKANGGNFPNPTGNGDGYNTYLTMDTDGRGWVFRRGVGGTDFGAAFTSGWILNNGVWQANASMRAPIFYDSNNTGYYVDPSSVSVLSDIRINDGNVQLRSNNVPRNTKWRALEGNTDVGISLYNAQDVWCMQLYANAGSEYGFLNGNWAAWDFRKVPSGNLFLNNQSTYYVNGSEVYMNRVYGTADIRSPIFYDLDNTGYYGNFASTSTLNVLDVNSGSSFGTWYVYGNGSTAGSANVGLNVYSTGGNGAIMAFHRGGHFAVNMGLDSDNVFRIGGWSAAANRLQLDMSGNLTVAGSISGSNSFTARAWVNFYGQGYISVRASGNVSSVSYNAVGNYTINFSTAMADANYATVGSAWYPGAQQAVFSGNSGGTYSTTAVQVFVVNSANGVTLDSPVVNVAIFR
jgi:hypothetical protein